MIASTTTSSTPVLPEGSTLTCKELDKLRRESITLPQSHNSWEIKEFGELLGRTISIGDKFTLKPATGVEITIQIEGHSSGSTIFRCTDIKGELAPNQQQWLHISKVGDVTGWMDSSLAYRINDVMVK